jgi:transketolase
MGEGDPELILLATGSELHLAVDAAARLASDGLNVRVVSLPCWELFEAQERSYRESVLPPAVRPRLAIEAGASLGWERWVGDSGAIIGLDHFGASAPGDIVLEKFGFSVDHVFGFSVDHVFDTARKLLAA